MNHLNLTQTYQLFDDIIYRISRVTYQVHTSSWTFVREIVEYDVIGKNEGKSHSARVTTRTEYQLLKEIPLKTIVLRCRRIYIRAIAFASREIP